MRARSAGLLDRMLGQARRFFRFALVGVLATLTHVGVVVIAVEAMGADPRWANLLGVALAMPVSYFGHYYFSFGSAHAHFSTVPRFAIVSLATLFTSQALMHMSVDGLGASYRLALGLFVLLMPLVSFGLQQILVFDRRLAGPTPAGAAGSGLASRVRDLFANAGWLTGKRALQISILFAAVNAIVAASIMQSYRPSVAGSGANALPDFAAFWAAAVLTLAGAPELAYDPVAHKAVQIEALGRDYQFWLSWFYPPTLLLIVAPFGALPLFVSFAAWNLLTFGFFLWVCHRILPRWATLLAAWGFAASLFVFAIGQTGFLIAGLLGLFLLELDRRPVLAGTALALLTVKPHLGLATPFALIAGGRWRVIGAAVVGSIMLAAAAHLALGADIWAAFLGSIGSSAATFAADEKAWSLYTTIYGAVRAVGAPFWLAALAHVIVATAALLLVVRLWRPGVVRPEIRATVLCYAMALATPRMLHYDLHILFIGGLFQVRNGLVEGFARWEKSLLLLAALLPFAFIFQAGSGQPNASALAAPLLLLSCLAGRPELLRLSCRFGPD